MTRSRKKHRTATPTLHGEWYDTAAAAAYLGLRTDTLQRYAHRGLLRPGRRIGRIMLFDRGELDRFAAIPRNVGRPKTSAG